MSVVTVADCREWLASLEPCSVDAIVTDPPYELSDSSKACPIRVLTEALLPKKSQRPPGVARDSVLLNLAVEVARLCGVGGLPGPATAMPVVPVAFDKHSLARDSNVKHGHEESCLGVPSWQTAGDFEPKTAHYLGNIQLECANPESLVDALACAGTSFMSGGVGVGFRVLSSGLPCLQGSSGVVDDGDAVVRLINDSFAHLVGTLSGAEHLPVARLHVTDGSVERLSTYGALALISVLQSSCTQLVGAFPRAGGASAMPQPGFVRYVVSSTYGALAFDLKTHSKSIAQKGFMGKAWDGSKIAYDVDMWRAALAAAKPGAHLLAFGGTRTYHRMACAIEDAGWQVRDCLSWLYGSGFPKSHDVSKAITKSASSTEVEQWDGWGTALKPAWEPVVLARKPLDGTVAANVLAHGCGGLNVDGCRVETGDTIERSGALQTMARETIAPGYDRPGRTMYRTDKPKERGGPANPLGRWPANVALDEEAGTMLDEQSGHTVSSPSERRNGDFRSQSKGMYYAHSTFGHSDSGVASRFFYCAKSSKREREAGLAAPDGKRANGHPTVKPISLMRWLVRLVTPPDGLVIDPFAGSGTTGIAAVLEGFRFAGCEQSEEYAAIAVKRIEHWKANRDDASTYTKGKR